MWSPRCPMRRAKPPRAARPMWPPLTSGGHCPSHPPPEREVAIALDLGVAEVAALDPEGPPRLLGALERMGDVPGTARRRAPSGQHARQRAGRARTRRRPPGSAWPSSAPMDPQLRIALEAVLIASSWYHPRTAGAGRRAAGRPGRRRVRGQSRSSSAVRWSAPAATGRPPKPARSARPRAGRAGALGAEQPAAGDGRARGHVDRRLPACGGPVAAADRHGPRSGHAQRRPRELHVAQPHEHHAGKPGRGQGGPGQRAGARVDGSRSQPYGLAHAIHVSLLSGELEVAERELAAVQVDEMLGPDPGRRLADGGAGPVRQRPRRPRGRRREAARRGQALRGARHHRSGAHRLARPPGAHAGGPRRRPRRRGSSLRRNLELAERWASPYPLGMALRVAGVVRGKSEGMDLLRRSVEVLEQSSAVLEHAASLSELGAALRRANRRAEAREPCCARPWTPHTAAGPSRWRPAPARSWWPPAPGPAGR